MKSIPDKRPGGHCTLFLLLSKPVTEDGGMSIILIGDFAQIITCW